MRPLVYMVLGWLMIVSLLADGEDRTIRGLAQIYQICQGIAADVKRDAGNQEALLTWLIDLTPGIDGELEQIKGEVNFFAGHMPALHMSIVVMKNENILFLPATKDSDKIIRA